MLIVAVLALTLIGMQKEYEKKVDGLESLVEFYREDNLRLETELHELKRMVEK